MSLSRAKGNEKHRAANRKPETLKKSRSKKVQPSRFRLHGLFGANCFRVNSHIVAPMRKGPSWQNFSQLHFFGVDLWRQVRRIKV